MLHFSALVAEWIRRNAEHVRSVYRKLVKNPGSCSCSGLNNENKVWGYILLYRKEPQKPLLRPLH